MNADPQSPFRTDELIAFGDFLTDQSKVQAADVGVKLVPKNRRMPLQKLPFSIN